ncbi:5-formyltetrahydrofolate cyclo-ligase [Cyphellophora europaea CBS 101466]|uniref:5-formyltetrahydrofolate cyclo-ligase n=1 Tax=Cyphellophora europaea (strain CBS 101466) TaxID=1220924 RepID=W2RZF2_CYPE1|nr:5-formyltetrahydrofolate cyclo-ligase [Cyphellophora europaea CBS 101466]ETN41715.1 5-formyltetrahydrofolate cyclo-ligase [Cyphellophora europaea CBS 101466]
MDGLREQKALLRKAVRAQLAKLSADEINQQSESITEQVRDLAAYQNARAVCVFLSMPGKEVSTSALVLDAFKDGKSVYVPYIHAVGEGKQKEKVIDMLKLWDKNDFDSLIPDSWGIPSLDHESVGQRDNALGGKGPQKTGEGPQEMSPELDLIFMPAVAFDRSHRRLGHGKGFYDRYLQKYHSAATITGRTMPALVGLALQQQLLPISEDVPVDRFDWLVDSVVVAK